MTFLATSTKLGTLEALEIYIQYNGARLLSCKNQTGKIFLALWVDEEEDKNLWLYMLVSLDRLQSIRTGKISLHEAFSNPESSYLHEITYSHINLEWDAKEITVDALEEDCLPMENTSLGCDPITLPYLESQKVIENAITKTREVVNIILEPLSKYPNEFPAFKLGEVLCTFQPLISQLIVSANAEIRMKSKELYKKSEFNVFATSPGSFQVELASSVFEPNLLGNSLAGDAIESLINLLQLGSDSKKLHLFLSQSNKKVAVKYCSFLKALISSGTGVVIEWGSPTLTRGGSVRTSLKLVREILEVIEKIDSLEDKEYEIIGELFKVDKDNWKFGVKELSTNFSYKGDILEQAKRDAGTATISNLYVATIIETFTIVSTINDIKNHYELIALRPYTSSVQQLNLVE